MTPPSLNWLRLEMAVPRQQGDDVRFLINGAPASAQEFHEALVSLDRAVFAYSMAEAIERGEAPV